MPRINSLYWNIISFLDAEEEKWEKNSKKIWLMSSSLVDAEMEILNLFKRIQTFVDKAKFKPEYKFYDTFGSLKVHKISVDELTSGKVPLDKAPILNMSWETFMNYRAYLYQANKEDNSKIKLERVLDPIWMPRFGWSPQPTVHFEDD